MESSDAAGLYPQRSSSRAFAQSPKKVQVRSKTSEFLSSKWRLLREGPISLFSPSDGAGGAAGMKSEGVGGNLGRLLKWCQVLAGMILETSSRLIYLWKLKAASADRAIEGAPHRSIPWARAGQRAGAPHHRKQVCSKLGARLHAEILLRGLPTTWCDHLLGSGCCHSRRVA